MHARARCSRRCIGRCRVACSRSSAPRVARVDELVADLMARSQETLCVGDGALRYRREICDGFHCEFADEAYPSAGALVQLAHARALREEWDQPGRHPRPLPAPARRRDQLGDASSGDWTQGATDREHPRADARSRRQPAARHRADAAPARRADHGDRTQRLSPSVERQRVPRRAAREPLRQAPLPRRPARPDGARLRRDHVRPRRWRPRRGRRGAHHEHRCAPRRAAHRGGQPTARRPRRRGDPPRLRGLDTGGAVDKSSAPRSCTAGSGSCRPACARSTTRTASTRS